MEIGIPKDPPKLAGDPLSLEPKEISKNRLYFDSTEAHRKYGGIGTLLVIKVSDLINCGVYVFTPEVFTAIKDVSTQRNDTGKISNKDLTDLLNLWEQIKSPGWNVREVVGALSFPVPVNLSPVSSNIVPRAT
ncbi:unnamed protein product [Eruca vesicaria subsp. sativa]|uniref:Uncharacterized protein n=1 Tax=Eruca vesicaria subsp. sativa TaxID=29727 RepID=A0ABC8LFN9_ERUVS|nr:unnamed protein product [Eruca vesicaria subsp. sativa]